MTELATLDAYGALIEPATLRIQRLLPGPAERVWDYLTKGELRRQWLASGEMALAPGAEFELVWRNDELSDPPGRRPEGFGEQHSMQSRILAADPPRMLSITFGGGEVDFTLEPKGGEVLLTVIHRRVPDRETLLKVSAGWHAHLDILADRMRGRSPTPFWDHWSSLKQDYEARLPG